MAKDFLLEIGTEEMPASSVWLALEELKKLAKDILGRNNLSFSKIEILATPRRLALLVSNLAERQSDVSHEVKGPARKVAYSAEGEPTLAAYGFAKAQKVDVKKLVARDTVQGEYVFAIKKEKGKPTLEILPVILPELIGALSFPKSMRWQGNLRFVRPVRWLLSLYDKKVVNFSLDGMKSANLTYGHRFLVKNPLLVKEAKDYIGVLEQGKVLVNQKRREKIILAGIDKISSKLGGNAVVNPVVLAEVIQLVENPQVVFGTFSQEYLKLPREIITTALETHQRYFAIESRSKELLPYFIVVHNGDRRYNNIIRKGHERVLQARLADAQFFFEEDTKTPLEAKVEELKGVIFQSKLGTLADKTKRITSLTQVICKKLQLSSKAAKQLVRAAYLSKADLVTEMVTEFPTLQGTVGKTYALLSGESKEVAEAILEHWLPRGAGDIGPRSLISQVLSLADKIDSIVGYFLVDLRPSASEDPYQIRRQTQAVIAILADSLKLSLDFLLDASLKAYNKDGVVGKDATKIKASLKDFFQTRLRAQFLADGFNYDVIDAVLSGALDDIKGTKDKIVVISKYRQTKKMDDLLTAFMRCKNLADAKAGFTIRNELLSEREEKSLFAELEKTERSVDASIAGEQFNRALDSLAKLRPTIDKFFNEVLVIAEDKEVRQNRLALLNRAVAIFNKVGDFSKLVIPGVTSSSASDQT